MGMTIDEALKIWLPVIQTGVETMPECKEALNMAINAMHKYQRIEQIVKSWNDMNSFDSMVQISEVLKDGNDD